MNKKIIFFSISSFLAFMFIYYLLKPSIDDKIDTWIVEGQQVKLTAFLFNYDYADDRNEERVTKVINAAYSENYKDLITYIEFQIFKGRTRIIDNKEMNIVFNAIVQNEYQVDETLLKDICKNYLIELGDQKTPFVSFLESQNKNSDVVIKQIVKSKSFLVSEYIQPSSKRRDITVTYKRLNILQHNGLGISITHQDSSLTKLLEQFIHNNSEEIINIENQIKDKKKLLSEAENSVYEINEEIRRTEKLLDETEKKRNKLPEIQWISGYITDEVSALFPMTARSNTCSGLYEFSSGGSLALVCMQEGIFNRQGYTRILVKYVGDETAVNQYSGHKIYLPLYVEVTELERKYRNAVINIRDKTKRELRQLKNNPILKSVGSKSKKLNLEINRLEERIQHLINDANQKIKIANQNMVESYSKL